MSKTRAIRFSDKEDRQIEEFLKSNPLFDFSSLARIAIVSFMKNPTITVRPIKDRRAEEDKRKAYGQSQ